MPSGPVASKHEELQGYTEQTRKPPGVSLGRLRGGASLEARMIIRISLLIHTGLSLGNSAGFPRWAISLLLPTQEIRKEFCWRLLSSPQTQVFPASMDVTHTSSEKQTE